MSKKICEGRRNFLKTSAVGAAGLALAGPLSKKAKAVDLPVKLIPLSTTKINQDVDNLRVAYITDDTAKPAECMVRSSTYPGFDSFNNPTNATTGVNYANVKTKMDKLACALTNNADIDAAWGTLLKIPSTKTWATAKAAIKINSIGSDHAAVPIVAKICEVLIGKGMPEANICVFDMTQGGAKGIYDKYRGAGKQLPAGILFGGNGNDAASTNAKYTAKFPAGYSMDATYCIDGVDIYVNIGNNKGHDQTDNYSGVTMCLKNNFGTVCFGHNGMDQLTAANSCDYIMGNIPTAYPAKQQLCIVDSLWAGNPGDWSGGISNGNDQRTIVMGTFAGAVDYVTTNVIRKPKFSSSTNYSVVDQFLSKFGYSAATDGATLKALTTGSGKGLVNAADYITSTLPRENQHLSRAGVVQISVAGSGIKSLNTTAYLSKGETVKSAEIFTMQGKKVRTLSASGGMHIIWDGTTDSGSLVRTGNYILKVQGSRTQTASEVIIQR
jgi:hypothetical protein